MKKWGKDKMPTGYFWDLYGLLPESLALAAGGLCKAEDTCSEIHKANPSVDKQDTKFQVETLEKLSKICTGNCPEGTVAPGCKKKKTKCELESCDDPEKLKKCHCEDNGTTVAEGEKVCAENACPEDVDACVIDWCISGATTTKEFEYSALSYKNMTVDACEVKCEECEQDKEICSLDCEDTSIAPKSLCSPSCLPAPEKKDYPKNTTYSPTTFVPTHTPTTEAPTTTVPPTDPQHHWPH